MSLETSIRKALREAAREHMCKQNTKVQIVDKIEVRERTVVVGRKRKVYDAEARIGRKAFFQATSGVRKEAVAQVNAQLAYVRAQYAASLGGWALYPCGLQAWTLEFPYGGAYLFSAETFGDACVHLVAAYGSTHEVGRFVSACEAKPAEEIIREL